MAALLITRKVVYATAFAHTIAVIFSVGFPFAAAFGPGLGLVTKDGEIGTYLLMVIPGVPPIVAFTLREKKSILGYSGLSAVLAIILTLWNPRDNDLTNVFTTFVLNLVILALVTFALAFFTDVADGLQEESVAIKGRMKVAQREAKAERRANEAKTRFVSVMSHEIRNPLQAILLQLEMLDTTNLTEVQGDYVSGITRASNVLLSIVNDILDVTKIESGAIALESVPMSLRDVVEFTLHTNAPKAAKQGVELLCNIDPTLNTSVLGDPTRIRQVLHNFVGNALKFTEAGEVEVTLALIDDNVQFPKEVQVASDLTTSDTEMGLVKGDAAAAARRRLRWKLSVRDTGIGIDEAGKQKLFQEFSQVDETTTRMYGGTGLGLFICKELSEIMGGAVSVESEPGVGSTFSATFLVEESDEVDDVPVHVVSSDVSWTILLYATNNALMRTVRQYVAFFFSGCARVQFVTVDRPKQAEQRIRALQKESSATTRLVVLANHSDCTRSLAQLLTSNDTGACVPIVLSEDPVASVRTELAREGWRNIVHKPVSLRQLCSTLDRAIGGDGGAVKPLGNVGTHPADGDGARRLNDGTLTRGKRQPTATEIAASSAANAAAHPERKTILIVDDFELVRSLVQQVVTTMGYNTLVAANGREALEIVKANYERVAMVLMDCEMPIMDGYEATEAIRAFEEETGVPPSKELFVCAMTANAMREDVKKCFSRRMSGFLAKPVKRADVEKVLAENANTPGNRGAGRSTTKRGKGKKARGDRGDISFSGSGHDDASSSSSASGASSLRRGSRRSGNSGGHPSLTASPMKITLSMSATPAAGGKSKRKKRAKPAIDEDRSTSV
jgi:signal transduction histidine kinase/CheY-like chemotaxis protein